MGRFKRVPMAPPGTMTQEVLLPQGRSGCWVLLVLHASLCGCCHGPASQHSEVQVGSDVLLQPGQVLGRIVLALVQEPPARREQTTRGSFHGNRGLVRSSTMLHRIIHSHIFEIDRQIYILMVLSRPEIQHMQFVVAGLDAEKNDMHRKQLVMHTLLQCKLFLKKV